MEKFKYNKETGVLIGYTLEGAVHGLNDILSITVDCNKSVFNPRVSKIITDKGVVQNLRWCQSLRKLVSLGGGTLQDGNNISRVGGSRGKYIVKLEPSLKVEVQPTPCSVEPDDVTISTEDTVVVEKEVVDLTFASSLYDPEDDKGSRKSLDNYAESFGINLNGRKSFKNMLKDLTESVEGEA